MASLNEIKLRAQESQVSNILTEEHSDFNAFVPWDDKAPQKALVPQRFMVENRVLDQTEVQPNAGFNSGSFLNGSVVDFRLDTNDISVIDHGFLAFNITNSTGGGVTLPPTPFWFDKIEIMNASSNVLATIYDIDIWQSICMLPRVDFDALATLFNTTTAYSTAGVVLANGASTELYLPLIAVLNSTRLHLPGLDGALIFRFRTKASAMTLIAGTHPTFTKVVMLLSGFDEPQSKRNMRSAFYRNQVTRFQQTPLYLPFYSFEHFTFSQALTPSVRSEIKLNGFAGMMSSLFILVRALPLTAANQGVYIPLDSFAVQDQSGNIFCGNHVKTHARSRVIIAGQLNNLSAANSNYYMVPFSSSVVQDFITGSVHGFQVLKGTETLAITPTAALVAGNYQIDVIGLRGTALRIQKGQVEKRM